MKKALIVIDYQNDFIDGSLGFEGAAKIGPLLSQKCQQALEEGTCLIFTMDTHGEDYLQTSEGKGLPIVHCVKGTRGWQLSSLLQPYFPRAKQVFEKGAFGSLQLAEYLRAEQFDWVELCGLVSNICVLSNAVLAKAALPEAIIQIDARATAGADQALHQKALKLMASLQMDVVNL